tara:strand:- start:1282 stop:1410 length:129 start_codon:yes stop_codon:yes gene_type:complete
MFRKGMLDRILLEGKPGLSAASHGFSEVNKAAANPFSAFAGR